MPHSATCTLFALLLVAPMLAQTNTTLLADIDHRAATSLNGDWHTIVDQYATGLYDFHQNLRKDGFFMNAPFDPHGDPHDYNFANAATLRVPGDWNTQRPDLLYYEGPIWYEKDFQHTAAPNTRTFLHIGAANYRTFVWVNTKKICQHEGGFTPFDCDITAALHDGNNFVVLSVDNTRIADGVPTLQTDWWNYGGLTRDVSLVDVPTQFIDDYDLHLSRTDHSLIEGYVHVEGAPAGSTVTITIPELRAKVQAIVGDNSRAPLSIPVKSLSLWSPENPKLYKVELASGSDKITDEIGFRTIETLGTQILLNGQPVFLRGISIHAEAPYRTGRAYTQKDVDTLLGWAKELGCNYVRLAHYPHDERMTRTADRLGVMVWSEIPDYWALQFDNPAVLEKSKQQLTEMIRRDRDKASIILWSVANETPNTEARTKYLTTMVDLAHQLDSTRLVTAALLVRTEKNATGSNKIVDDPLGKALDVIGTNEYIGWYEQTAAGADTTTWDIRYDKPLIMSEWGGGAKAGNHAPAGDAHPPLWTEEYQAEIYRHQIAMLNKIPQLRGTSPWLLMDFRSARRVNPGLQDNFNRKGLISDQGEKKQAFFILQKAYKDKTLGKAE
ncbi:glycoside hydrolase family 2 protein [Granulicella sp. S190]|uniref:glycoside hydrolase family 2 protein n=1 Tax=Granulicella sp. S190 TaxID=1747226 RepID=UPI00131BCA37|nr:glycoside hydrolase family 2 TIM barrel-domain containing protein [Granulicella sp. S190]